MKDRLGHGSEKRGAHSVGIDQVGRQPLTMYHGSSQIFSAFQLGKGTTPGSQNGVWLADDPKTATEYAEIAARYGGEATLYHATVSKDVKLATRKQWDDIEKSIPGTRYSYERDKQTIAILKSKGYGGMRSDTRTFIFDPKHISITKKEKLK